MHSIDEVRAYYTPVLKEHFGEDTRRINHALKVLGFAERIAAGENVPAAMRETIVITALLHDTGIKEAERKYHSSAGPYQEQEGPAIVRAMMARNQEEPALIERVAYIVGGHHTAAKNDGLDFQIIWEADLLVNIDEDGLTANREQLPVIIEKNFRTPTGRRIAQETYLA